MAEKIFTFDEAGMRTTIKGVRKALGMQGRPIPQPKGPRDEGGGCDTQNAKIQWTVFGKPTGGTFSSAVNINGTIETITFNYNANAASVKTALAGHSLIASTDLTVTGGAFPNATVEVEFIDTLASKNIALPISDWGSLTGGSGVAVLTSLSQLGHA